MERAPITIKFMLACHCSADPANEFDDNHWNSPAGRDARQWLRNHGLIDDDNRSTARGKA